MDECTHEGDEPVILEITYDGQMRSTAPRCPRCGFRSMTIETDDGRDVTDQYVIAEERSTWAAWDAAMAD